jgi:hypothetical protein
MWIRNTLLFFLLEDLLSVKWMGRTEIGSKAMISVKVVVFDGFNAEIPQRYDVQF